MRGRLAEHAAAGALLGGGKGAYQAISSPVAVAGVDSTRLRVNQLLNTSGKLGRGAGAQQRLPQASLQAGKLAMGQKGQGAVVRMRGASPLRSFGGALMCPCLWWGGLFMKSWLPLPARTAGLLCLLYPS
jgi:hypothetical protein